MNNIIKIWITILLLVVCIFLSFAFPKAKYKGTGFISKLEVPAVTENWQGRDVSEKLNILSENDVYNFLSEAVAYEYVNKKGEHLLFIILDAGNFHHPNVCFTYAGYEIKEMNDTEFSTLGGSLQTHTLYTKKGNDNSLTFYWIIIDKNVSHQWIEQKVKQLYFSMFNKERVGLMVRIDIPTTENDIKKATIMAQNFIDDMMHSLDREAIDNIFGEQQFPDSL